MRDTRLTEQTLAMEGTPFGRLQDWVMKRHVTQYGDQLHQQHPQDDPEAQGEAPTQEEASPFFLPEGGLWDVYEAHQAENRLVRLNATDKELAHALEPLLPTPHVRYAVMKQRIEQEELTLKHWQSVLRNGLGPVTADTLPWMQQATKRLGALARHNQRVSDQLVYASPRLGRLDVGLHRLADGVVGTGQQLATQALQRLQATQQGPLQQQVRAWHALRRVLLASDGPQPTLVLDARTRALVRSRYEALSHQLVDRERELSQSVQAQSATGRLSRWLNHWYSRWFHAPLSAEETAHYPTLLLQPTPLPSQKPPNPLG